MRFGALPYDLAHLLGGAALVLSFALLYQRQTRVMINAYAWQAVLLALAAAWQGWVRHETDLYVTAAITLAANAVLIPTALHRITRKLAIGRAADIGLGIFPSLILGLALVVLAILVVLPTTQSGPGHAAPVTREELAFALSIVLLGLLVMITRRNAFTQVIGFLSLENGLILAAVGMPGMPLVVELAVAVLVLVAFVVFGLFFFRIREQFESLDVTNLDRVGRSHR